MSEQAQPRFPAGDASPRPRLATVAEVARRHGHEALARQAEDLLARAADGRFFLAVVGQFKRGKSTLVNALLGTRLLPTGVVPVTAAVTIVEHGDEAAVLVECGDGSTRAVPLAALADFITEDGNPGNRRGVAGVVVRSPAPLLRSGLCLVDTPGLGSVFELSTEATHAFVPKIDAALVVLGPDPPISADELALVERIARQVPDLLFVLNKADTVDDEHRAAAAAFCARMVRERLGEAPPEFLPVSARAALSDAGRGDAGVGELRKRLERLAEGSGARLVRRALERGEARLADELAAVLELERRALTSPIEDLEARIGEFRRSDTDLRRMLQEMGYLLRAEVDRAEAWLEGEATAFIASQRADLGLSLGRRLEPLAAGPAGRLRRQALSEAREEVKARLDAWLRKLEPRVEEEYRRLTDRFVEAGNAAAARISAAARDILGLKVDPAPPEPGFRAPSRLYYRLEDDGLFLDPSGAWTRLSDRLSGRARLLARVHAWAGERAEHFLATNATRIVDDLKERIEESLRRFKGEMRRRLEGALQTAEEAQARAREMHRAGAASVAGGLAAVEASLTALRRIQERDPQAAPAADG